MYPMHTDITTLPGSEKDAYEYSTSIFETLMDTFAAAAGTTFPHLMHDYHEIHYGLFFLVNFYFVQNLLVVLMIVSTHSFVNAARFVLSKVAREGGNADGGGGEVPYSDWEDGASRLGLLRAMAYSGRGRTRMCTASDPPPGQGLLSKVKMELSDLLKGWRSRMTDLLLFREAARLRLLLASGLKPSEFEKRRASSLVSVGANMQVDKQVQQTITFNGLDYVSYFESSVASILTSMVHISARVWLTIWLSLTAFLSTANWLQAAGFSAALSNLLVLVTCQVFMLSVAVWLSSFLTYIKGLCKNAALISCMGSLFFCSSVCVCVCVCVC